MTRTLSALLLASLAAIPSVAADTRFGFVGTGGKPFAQKFGVPYYALEGNYHPSTGTLFSSVHPDNDPNPGYKVLRKVAKLNVRTDALGQTNAEFQAAFETYAQNLTVWYATPGVARGAKPAFTWHAPDANALAAAESLQIVETIRREKQRSPAVTGTVWEIGNEPNFFPALLPAQYAAIYANYHRIIKREDSTAKIAFGPLFIRETGADLKPATREIIVAKLTTGGALALLGQSKFDSLVADIAEGTLFTRVFNLATASYVSQAFAALPSNVRPDYITLHVYPYDDRAPVLTKTNIQTSVDSLVTALSGITGGKPVWITEFGNINPALSASAVASGMSDLIDVFVANPGIGNLFYYKGTGADQQLDMLSGLGAGASGAPLTRLANDSAFSPSDGNFSCAQLNAIGQMYYQRAVGAACADAAPTAAPALTFPANFATGVPVSPSLAWGTVTGATYYRFQISAAPDFTTLIIHDSTLTGSPRPVSLSQGTAYYWRVRGRNAFGEGPWSSAATFTTALGIPAAPSLASPAAFASGVSPTPTLTWSEVAGAATYRVQVSADPSFATTLLDDSTVTATSRSAGLLGGNTAYYWRVRAKNAVGTGNWSTTRQFTTGALPLPDAPTLVSPANFASVYIDAGTSLVWSRATYATTYQVQLSANSLFDPLLYNDSTLVDTSRIVPPGTGFGIRYWRVRGRNSTGAGAWSETRSHSAISIGAILPGSFAGFGLRLDDRTLRFRLARSERVQVTIYDAEGAQLFALDQRMEAGEGVVPLPASPGGSVRILDLRIGAARDVLKLAP